MITDAHHRPVSKTARANAQRMRRKPTDAELAMWRLLRNRRLSGVKFRRQVPVEGYILDFVCFDRRLVIEIDGSQHVGSQGDAVRDAALHAEGFVILRYWNNDVLQRPDSVLEDLVGRIVPRTTATTDTGTIVAP